MLQLLELLKGIGSDVLFFNNFLFVFGGCF